jgi:hypothetical protein
VGEEDWRALSQRAKKLDKENYWYERDARIANEVEHTTVSSRGLQWEQWRRQQRRPTGRREIDGMALLTGSSGRPRQVNAFSYTVSAQTGSLQSLPSRSTLALSVFRRPFASSRDVSQAWRYFASCVHPNKLTGEGNINYCLEGRGHI